MSKIEYTVTAASYMQMPPQKQVVTVGPEILPSPAVQKLMLQAILGWTTLDYYIRLALRRLMGKEITAAEVVEVMSSGNHQKWLEELRTACNSHKLSPEAQRDVIDALDAVGTKRSDQKIYGRRNEVIHSLFGLMPSGTETFQRIGDTGYTQQRPVNSTFLADLVKDTWEAITKLEQATRSIA